MARQVIDKTEEEKLVKFLEYIPESEEPITDAVVCRRFHIEQKLLSKVRRRNSLPSSRGGAV